MAPTKNPLDELVDTLLILKKVKPAYTGQSTEALASNFFTSENRDNLGHMQNFPEHLRELWVEACSLNKLIVIPLVTSCVEFYRPRQKFTELSDFCSISETNYTLY